VEMNFGRRNESADATPALHNAFAFKRRQGMAGGHQADCMELGQGAFGANRGAGAKMARGNALPNSQLDGLVSGEGKANFAGSHSMHLIRNMNNRREKCFTGSMVTEKTIRAACATQTF